MSTPYDQTNRTRLLACFAAVPCLVLSGCGLPTIAKVAIGLGATQIPRLHRPIRVDANPSNPGATPTPTPIFVDLAKMRTSNGKYHSAVEKHNSEIYADFSLYTVEFDDQGNFWNRPEAMRAVDCAIREGYSEAPPAACEPVPDPDTNQRFIRPDRQGALFVTLVHGWKHGCQVCDTNLTCWREELQLLAELEKDSVDEYNASHLNQSIKPRRVVGIYVAWRGKRNIWRQYIVDDFDFVDRKEAAHRIGHADGPKFFTELDARFRKLRASESGAVSPSQMFTFGHSFGGALLYSSVQALFQKRMADATEQGSVTGEVDSALGDKVFLVNPAFEALIYESFHRDILRGTFQPDQPAVLLNITSRTDWVTHYVFPFGRAIFLPLQIFQIGNIRRTEIKSYFAAAGHLQAHRTHELKFAQGGSVVQEKPISNWQKIGWDVEGTLGIPPGYERHCQCQTRVLDYKNGIENKIRQIRQTRMLLRSAAAQARGPIGDFQLSELPGYSPNIPYFVVYADSKIIDGHGDIFNPNFIKFLAEYLSLYRNP